MSNNCLGSTDSPTLIDPQNNISSIAYRVYEPSPDSASTFPSVAVELESSLRHDGHLVFYDSSRRGIWYFRIENKDDGLPDDNGSKLGVGLESSVQVLGYNLSAVTDGTYEPTHFQRGRLLTPQALKNMPIASSPLTQGPMSPQLPADQESTTAPRLIYENFMTALLLSITTSFCPATGSIPLNYRTVLFSPASSNGKGDKATEPDHDASMGTFGAHLTTAGTLVISFSVSPCQGLLSLDNFFAASLTTPGQHVLAAPFGVHASKVAASMGELGTASLAQTPTTQILSLRGYSELNDGLWKQACLKLLRLRGIPASVLENCSWVTVSIARRRLQDTKVDGSRPKDSSLAVSTMIPWPGPLCFRQRVVEVSSTNRLADNILIGREEHRDPLDRAGRWLDSTTERDEQISRRNTGRYSY